MNGTPDRIEVFAPFGAAFELMQRILFRPFDFGKWLVIAFAAFIAGAWGGGLNFNPMTRNYNWSARNTATQNLSDTGNMPGWAIVLIFVAVVIGAIVALLIMWIVSRGRFVFTDCVVRNRGAIVEPWREYRREGNSYFLFTIVVALIALLTAGAIALLIGGLAGIFGAGFHWSGMTFGVGVVFAIILFALVWVSLAIFFALVTHFMVPVMYRRRCGAWEAFGDVARLVLNHPGPFILLVLFGIVLVIALGMLSTIVMCVTCCIGGLPYVHTVILLPVYVWLRAFTLLFIRQFGPEYDAWGGVAPLPVAQTPAPPSPTPPPAEPPPPLPI